MVYLLLFLSIFAYMQIFCANVLGVDAVCSFWFLKVMCNILASKSTLNVNDQQKKGVLLKWLNGTLCSWCLACFFLVIGLLRLRLIEETRFNVWAIHQALNRLFTQTCGLTMQGLYRQRNSCYRVGNRD